MFQALLPSKKTIFLLNLGTTFDPTLSMDSYISSLCRSSYFHLWNLSLARKYLHEKAIQCTQPSLPELTIVIVYCMESLINILKNYKISLLVL